MELLFGAGVGEGFEKNCNIVGGGGGAPLATMGNPGI